MKAIPPRWLRFMPLYAHVLTECLVTRQRGPCSQQSAMSNQSLLLRHDSMQYHEMVLNFFFEDLAITRSQADGDESPGLLFASNKHSV